MRDKQLHRPRILAFGYYLKLFIRARWLAVAASASGVLFCQLILGLEFEYPWIYSIIGLIFFYNVGFWIFVKETDFHENLSVEHPQETVWLSRARRLALLQIILDLVALFFLIHFTGGLENPFVIFFLLHVVAAAILLETGTSVLVALFTVVLIFTLGVTEKLGWLTHYHQDEIYFGFEPLNSWLFVLGLPAILFAVIVCLVALTIFIMDEISRRRDTIIVLSEELDDKNKRLLQLDKMRKQTMAVVSHDLKAPINAVSSYLMTLRDGYLGPLSEKQNTIIKKCLSRLARLKEFLSDVLDWQTIERGELQQKMIPTQLFDILARTIDDYKDAAEEKNVTLSFETDDKLPLVSASAARMAQVFDNLISNGVKYTPSGGMVKVSVSIENAGLLFAFSDTGIGMSEEDQAHLFEDFYRSPNVKKKYDGTGLGLAVVKRIVRAHHGEVWAESELNKGTTFFVRVPVGRLSQPPRG